MVDFKDLSLTSGLVSLVWSRKKDQLQNHLREENAPFPPKNQYRLWNFLWAQPVDSG